MAFPQVAATASGNSAANVTSHTVNLPASIASGDLLIAVLCTDQNPVFTWPAGWTQVFAAQHSAALRVECRYRIADGTEGASITVTTDTSEGSAHLSYRITGHNSTAPAAGTAVTSGFGADPNPPSLTPSWGAKDTLWIPVVGWRRGNIGAITGWPTNYTANQVQNRWNDTDGTGAGWATRELNATSEDPGVFTLALASYVVNTIAVEPSAGGAPASILRQMMAHA